MDLSDLSRKERRAYEKRMRKQQSGRPRKQRPRSTGSAAKHGSSSASASPAPDVSADVIHPTEQNQPEAEQTTTVEKLRDNDPALVAGEYLTPRQACQLLAISRSTLDRLSLPGRIKLGRQVRFQRRKLEQWLQANMT